MSGKNREKLFTVCTPGPLTLSAVPHHSPRQKHWARGGWNSSRRTANLRDTSSEIKKGKKRPGEERDRTVINVNDVTASMAITVSLVSGVWLCGQNYEFSHRHGHQGVI